MKLIDADYLIDTIGAMIGYGTTPTDIWDMIHDAPTIDAVSVVHGEWIHNPQIGWGETWVCSICGEKTTSSFVGKPRYECCPMCGAKMDGERKNNE